METINIRYQKLCEVKILHHFFLDRGNVLFDDLAPDEKTNRLKIYDIAEWLDIDPDEQTKNALANYGLLFKTITTGFRLLTETSAVDRSKQPIDTDLKLVFRLRFKGTVAERTALPIGLIKNGNPATYVFGNEFAFLNGGTFPALAVPPDPYNNIRRYRPGEIVQDNGKQYLALLQADNQGVSVTNNAFWRELPINVRYASAVNGRPLVSEKERDGFGQIEISGRSDLSNYRLLNDNGNLRNPVPTFEIRINKM